MLYWEGGNDINFFVKGYLLEMIKRIMGEFDNEGLVFGFSESLFFSLDRLVSVDFVIWRNEKDFSF